MQRMKLRGVKQTTRGDTIYEVVRVDNNDATVPDATVTDALVFSEISAPANPAANKAVLFARDSGAGKTQICARFPTGAVVVLGVEP